MTLAMLASAFLAVAAAAERAKTPPALAGQIPPTRNEIAHLLATVILNPGRREQYRLRRSAWRRRHQHRAQACHYQRQARYP